MRRDGEGNAQKLREGEEGMEGTEEVNAFAAREASGGMPFKWVWSSSWKT